METLSKEKIIKQAEKVENYQGNESDIVGAEKSGKYHGFIAGAEWATAQLKADKEELIEMLKAVTKQLHNYSQVWNYDESKLVGNSESLIKKHEK